MTIIHSKTAKTGGHPGDPPFSLGRLAAATAAAAIVGGIGGSVATTATLTLVDEQQHDDDQQNPVAITATEQVAQTHILHPLRLVRTALRLSSPFIVSVCAAARMVIKIDV